MSNFPLAQTIRHKPFMGTVTNPRGNVIETWGEPVDVAVYGWHISSTDEPQVAGHDRVVVDAQVLAPESWVPDPKDKVLLPSRPGEYRIVGEVEDYSHGPFEWRPGVVVNLQKVEG